MQSISHVEAIEGAGLKGDRYCIGSGSFNKKTGVGNRQVTIMNGKFFRGTGFKFTDSRRNIFTSDDCEVLWLIGRTFSIGKASMRGIKYCDPCERPSKLSGIPGFKDQFIDCGCIVAEVLEGGLIRVGDEIVPPVKGY